MESNEEGMPDKQPSTDDKDLKAPMTTQFDLPVDPDQGFKASQLKICSFKRPHMRAFHYSWWSFFIAFFIWFSIAPLLPEVRETLDLSKGDIWITNIVAVSGDIVMRFVFGAVCDKYGARRPMAAVLMLAAIPTACTGAVNSLAGLAILRLFIGIAGSSFVMCQCWSTRMVSTSRRRFNDELECFRFVNLKTLFSYYYIILTVYQRDCWNYQRISWWLGQRWRRRDADCHGYFAVPFFSRYHLRRGLRKGLEDSVCRPRLCRLHDRFDRPAYQ
jgi:hypothetical protein